VAKALPPDCGTLAQALSSAAMASTQIKVRNGIDAFYRFYQLRIMVSGLLP
jgi:hypothetical protein